VDAKQQTGRGGALPSDRRRAAVTRADVAKLAGVSTAVVSYVVNDGPRPVAPATAARVREAMELLGYLPNAAARALRLGRTHTLGLVMGDSHNPYYAEYTSELVKAAAASGWRLLIADSWEDDAVEAEVVEEFVARQVDALLFASSAAAVTRSQALLTSRTPTVLIDCPGPIPGQRAVGSDAAGGAEMLVRHLIEHGRRRIGLVIGDHGFGDPDPRERGWRRALQSAGLSDGPIVRVPWTRQGGYAGLGALLAEDPELDAVFASNDLHGVGVLRALHERGLAVPGDVAVVSFDGSVESEFCWPPLTVARQPIAALARAVIDLLDTPETPEGVHIELPTELIRRQSCGCDGTAVDEPRVEVLTRPRRHE
jgi:LacI family transcriptional regulator